MMKLDELKQGKDKSKFQEMVIAQKKYEMRIINQILKDHDTKWNKIEEDYKELADQFKFGVRH